MDPVRPQMREQLTRDCASLDWLTDPHQTPSGGSRALTPDRSKTPATGLYSKGIDTRWPVTEASLVETCKLNGVNPHAYFTDLLTRLVNGWPQKRIDELMPWLWVPQQPP